MQDYRTAFAEKGVIGSVLEFGGSTYVVYRAVDELKDRHNDNHHGNQNGGQNQGGSSGGETPPDTGIEIPPESSSDIWFFWDGYGMPVIF